MRMPSVRLNNGIEMPQIGLGTYKLENGIDAQRVIHEALSVGYRLLDTAKLYGNEESVGKIVRQSGIPREQIFVTTKLWPTDFFSPEKAFHKSFERLGLDYIDLYLIHWPIPAMPRSVWQTLEKLYDQKLVRSIGVSNYGIGDIERLLEYARIPPAVNQIKFSPFDYAEEVLRTCRAHDILVEAYSPLTRGAYLRDPVIVRIAAKYQKTPAQILIRWCIEHATVVIPKASSTSHLRENLEVFDFSLEESDMRDLDALS